MIPAGWVAVGGGLLEEVPCDLEELRPSHWHQSHTSIGSADSL